MWLLLVLATVPFPSPPSAEPPAEAITQESPANESPPADRFARRPASRRYIALGSKFFLHGYITGTFADFGKDFPNPDDPPPGQLLVPATDKSSFAYDWALFVGADVSESVRVVAETHFVSDPGGGFEPVIAATEANVTWMPFGEDPLRVSMGLFWVPFGLVTDDWFSTENLFALIPEAAKAFPLHYNERGVRVEGQFALGEDWGLNYSLSLGNGVRGLSIADQKSFDFDDNKAVVGRLGLFPGARGLEVGLSAMEGTFRDAEDPSRPTDDPQRYASEFSAWGLDATYSTPRLKLRGYWISSEEALAGAADLEREGYLLEASYTAWEGSGILTSFEPKVRIDHSRQDVLFGAESETEVLALGADLWLTGSAVLRVDYFLQDEKGKPDLDRDGVAVRLSAIF